MIPYIQTFSQDFSPAQLSSLQDLVQRARSGSALGEDEVQAILSSVESGTKPLFKAPEFGIEILDQCKLATALETLRVDLSTLMDQARAMETRMSQHESIQRNLINRISQAITRLGDLVETNRLRRNNPEFTEVKYVSFINAVNEDTSRGRARVDNKAGDVSCGTSVTRRYVNRKGDLRPSFNVTVHTAGVDPDSAESFLPENSVFPDDSYIWMENLLADGPLSGTYNSTSYEGAIVSLDVNMPQLETVNELVLSPAGQYPLTIIAAQYLDGSDYVSIELDVDVPYILEPNVRSIFRFAPVDTRSIRLVLLQPHGQERELILEKGQLKKSNWLNIILDRSLESDVNDNGTLPRKLLENRRDRVTQTLAEKRARVEETEPVPRLRSVIDDILAVDDTGLVRISKFEYTVGLKHLEINYHRYFDTSNYASPPMQATGSVFGLGFEATEFHSTYPDGTGSSPPITSIEYEVDLGGGHVIPVLPANTGRVESERLDFDTNRIARSRFNVSATPNMRVRKDGIQLTSGTDYTASWVAGDKVTITVASSAWVPSAMYTVSYDPFAGQDEVDILSLFDSIKPKEPQVFAGTGENNRVALSAHPFVLTELVRSKQYWTRLDPKDARWNYNFKKSSGARAATDPAYIVRVDGENYGQHPTVELVGNVTATATSLTIDHASDNISNAFPDRGVIKINSEQMYYGSLSGSGSSVTLSGLIRGYNNTTATTHSDNDDAFWQVLPFYEPVTVLVDGTKAVNVTNYATGKHPAFSNADGPPEFIQIGTSLYFDRPIPGKIEVWYRRLADFVSLRALLRSHLPSREYSPAIDNFAIKLKTATL